MINFNGAYIDAPPKNILEMLLKSEKWPKWDKTLDKVEVLDRVDQHNEILHLHVRRFFPSVASLTQAVSRSSTSIGKLTPSFCWP